MMDEPSPTCLRGGRYQGDAASPSPSPASQELLGGGGSGLCPYRLSFPINSLIDLLTVH